MANDDESQQQQGPQKSKHIRPRVQKKSPKAAKPKADNDVNVEETRKRMESWMGLGGSNINSDTKNRKNTISTKSSPQKNDHASKTKAPVIASKQPKPIKKQPVSILKSPKYSSKSPVVAVDAAPTSPSISSSVIVASDSAVVSAAAPIVVDDDTSNTVPKTLSGKSSVICKDIVVERDPTIAATKRKSFRRTNKEQNSNAPQATTSSAAHHASIEGYVPAGSSTAVPPTSGGDKKNNNPSKDGNNDSNNDSNNNNSNDNDDDGEPLVIDSLEGLMRAAGEPLPDSNKITPDTKMVEANISFSVMTQDQYETKLPALKEENEQERQRQLETFMGKHDIFGDDDDESVEGALDGLEDDNDDDDDDAVMELLLGSDMEDNETDNEQDQILQVKAFTLLWDALTNWMTHETVVWMKNLRDSQQSGSNHPETNNKNVDTEWTPMVDKSDIGASRCAGVLAMLRLYLGQCLQELGHPVESRRRAEKRLNDLMRTFDYSRENPKLQAGHWKAMACVLVDAVLVETRSTQTKVPPSVAKMGMSQAEFEYLSRKAVLIFE